MRVISSSGRTLIEDRQIDGASTDIPAGALLMPGVTDETNRSVLIIASGAAADAAGILLEAHTANATNNADPDTGLVLGMREVQLILPGDLVAADMGNDADNDVDVASATSTVLTITDIEDDIDGSWVYVRAGTGAGQLAYCTASSTTTMTIKNATGLTTLDNTSKVLIMRRIYHQTCALSATTSPGVNIASSAAAGSLPWRVLRNQVKIPGSEKFVDLDYTKHHGLTGLNIVGFKLRQILIPANTLFNPLD